MLTFLKTWLMTRLPRDEKGQDAAEYALLIGLIALVLVAAVTLLGTDLAALFGRLSAEVQTW